MSVGRLGASSLLLSLLPYPFASCLSSPHFLVFLRSFLSRKQSCKLLVVCAANVRGTLRSGWHITSSSTVISLPTASSSARHPAHPHFHASWHARRRCCHTRAASFVVRQQTSIVAAGGTSPSMSRERCTLVGSTASTDGVTDSPKETPL